MKISPGASPRSFGPFEVIGTIGRGGAATVYKVRHKPTGKVAALKVLPAFALFDADVAARFQLEFTAIRPLRHPNIVRPIALGEQDEVPYIVLELVPGQNLDVHLKEKGALPPQEAVAIFIQVGEGLRYLHGNHILHRDIKPSNIFLTPQGQAKLGDFGLLKNRLDDAHLTKSRQAMGTIEYGAPEQFEDAKGVDQRCDIYSLAATLYKALTGKFPFGNGGQLQILQRKFFNEFVPLRLLLPELDPALDEFVSRCLHPNPDQRPDLCDEFLAVLRNCRTGPMVPPGEVNFGSANVNPGGGRNRRATVRFAVDLTTTFVPFHQNMRGRWEATILDVSPLGLRLQTPRPVSVNAVLQVALRQGARPHLALVRWVKPGEGSCQIAGCSFVQPLSGQEFEALQFSCPIVLSGGRPEAFPEAALILGGPSRE